jgi:hypothetical protein
MILWVCTIAGEGKVDKLLDFYRTYYIHYASVVRPFGAVRTFEGHGLELFHYITGRFSCSHIIPHCASALPLSPPHSLPDVTAVLYLIPAFRMDLAFFLDSCQSYAFRTRQCAPEAELVSAHRCCTGFCNLMRDFRRLASRVVKVVSMAHAVTIIPLAFLCLDLPELEQDRAFGFHARAGNLYAITCGYGLRGVSASNTSS